MNGFRRWLFLLAVGFACPAGSEAGVLGYPGSSWGEATRDADNFEGYGSQGYVRQGADLLALPREHVLGVYVEGDWRFRSNNTQYYDAWSPVLGAEVRGSFYRFAVEYSHPRYTELGTSNDRLGLLATWYKDWKLFRGEGPLLFGRQRMEFPGDLWGQLSHSFDGLEGTGSQGHLNQSIRWLTLPGDVGVQTFAEYRWRVRELNTEYYNAYGPAIGFELDHAFVRAGVEYSWQYYPDLRQHRDRATIFLRWYSSWDLKSSR